MLPVKPIDTLDRFIRNTDAHASGGNCGVGAGGFQPGNKCATGGGIHDPSGFYHPRAKTPEIGYHTTSIESIKSIAEHGLVPMPPSGRSIPAVYLSDDIHPGSHEHAPEGLHEATLLLRAKTGHARGALDDTEVREFYGRKTGPEHADHDIGVHSGFMVGDRIHPEHVEVLRKSGSSRKWVPVKEYVKSEEFKRIHGQYVKPGDDFTPDEHVLKAHK